MKRLNNSNLSRKPYVVSGDIVPLLQEWVNQKGFILPPAEFFHQLREEFAGYMSGIFSGFEFVHEDELTEGLRRLVSGLSESDLCPISLDRIYYKTNPSLDITRLVDEKGEDRGLGRRPGTPPLLQQFKQLLQQIPSGYALVDDVIFAGDLLERIAKLLSKMGFQASLIIAGIGIGDGVERLRRAGYDVFCVRTYPEVIDEVCERDFYPGVPLSGRVFVGRGDIGVPYILPFGNPGKWASIPMEWQVPFSKFCIQQTISLFEEIEKYSNRIVACRELGRGVIGLPQDETRFVDALEYALKSL